MLCLYDNAGESFTPGRDDAIKPVTRHLVESSLLMFLFDPMQHQPFRHLFGDDVPSDPPMEKTTRQDQILIEVGNRIRRFKGMRDTDRYDRPLIVIVTKLDIWFSKLEELSKSKWSDVKEAWKFDATTRSGSVVLILDRIEKVSKAIRSFLMKTTPEIVTAAESLSKSVTYIGASALGVSPARHPEKKDRAGQKAWSIRPMDVAPFNVETPILFGLNQQFKGLVPGGRRAS
jgi:hypothetical protein